MKTIATMLNGRVSTNFNRLFRIAFLPGLVVVTAVDADASNQSWPAYGASNAQLAEQKYNPWAMPPSVNPHPQQQMYQGGGYGSKENWPKFVTPEELKALDRLPSTGSGADAVQPTSDDYAAPYSSPYDMGHAGPGFGRYYQPSYGGMMGAPNYMIDPYSGRSGELMFGGPSGSNPFGGSSGFPSWGSFPLPY